MVNTGIKDITVGAKLASACNLCSVLDNFAYSQDKSVAYIRNLIQGFVALATAAKEGLPLTPLWTLPAHPGTTLNPSNN